MNHSEQIVERMIRPSASISEVSAKILELYSIEVTNLKQLEGYDDLNFYVERKSPDDGSCVEKYICKIMNNLDSMDTDVIDAQHRIMKRLADRGIVASQPLVNNNNDYFSLERIKNSEHVFRLLTYIDGGKLNDCKPSKELYYNVGLLVGKIYQELKDLELEALKHRKGQWALESVPSIIQYVSVVPDIDGQNLVRGAVKQFEDDVVPLISDLESGVTHGDINEHNLLVDGTQVVGIIDFGDVCCAPFLFEIAICITYMIVHAQDLSVGREVLKGYQKYRQLSATEIRLLKICVAARLCQSLVLGCYSALHSPGNQYILSTQKQGWPVLRQLCNTSDSEILSLWNLEVNEL